jgi:hypothetical protein
MTRQLLGTSMCGGVTHLPRAIRSMSRRATSQSARPTSFTQRQRSCALDCLLEAECGGYLEILLGIDELACMGHLPVVRALTRPPPNSNPRDLGKR